MTNHEAADILRNIDCCANLADIKGAESAIYAAISALRAQEKEPKWISVEDRLPDEELPVLVTYLAATYGKSHSDGVAAIVFGDWYWREGSITDIDSECRVEITHWMPLPDPPTSMTIQN